MDVNWLAILVCGIVSMIVGSIWYGPLFGKAWQKHFNFTKKEQEQGMKDMPKTYAQMFVGSLITTFVLAVVISMAPQPSATAGMTGAFWLWVGFIVAVKYSEVLFEKKPLQVFFIESGYYLIFLTIAGAILGTWR